VGRQSSCKVARSGLITHEACQRGERVPSIVAGSVSRAGLTAWRHARARRECVSIAAEVMVSRRQFSIDASAVRQQIGGRVARRRAGIVHDARNPPEIWLPNRLRRALQQTSITR
jgi:hypothetical protein